MQLNIETLIFAEFPFIVTFGHVTFQNLHSTYSSFFFFLSIVYCSISWVYRLFFYSWTTPPPSFRLISWTGRKIDPVGVDYILQKLGFHHARTTIPKWLQRGVMDPLDKVLSVLIKKLGTALQDEKERKGRDKEEHWGREGCPPCLWPPAATTVQRFVLFSFHD